MSALELEKRMHFRREADRHRFEELTHLREAMEEALHHRERHYRELADAMPHIVWTARADGTLEAFNRQWYEYTGLSPEQTESWGWALVIHPEDLRRAMDAWDWAVAHGEGYTLECRLRRRDAIFRWHLLRVTPIQE